MHIDALLATLGRGTVEQESGGVRVHCPAHADGRPSLVISLKPDGRVLMHCRAGCSTTAVLAAVGLREADLFRVKGDPTVSDTPLNELDAGAVAALAQYINAAAACFPGSDGATYAFERFGITEDVARELGLGADDGTVSFTGRDYRSKAYRSHPRLVVPFADWHGVHRGLQGRDVRGLCPARWLTLANPEGMRWSAIGVFRLADSFDTVIVTEGPGDALTAVSAGYTAVAVRGAGVARSERAARELVAGAGGARIVLAGDNDQSGKDFNRELGRHLMTLGATAYVLAVPLEHKDLAAWREADPAGFAAALHAAESDAQPWTDDTPGKPAPKKQLRVNAMLGTDIENARKALDIVGPDTAWVDGVGFLTWNGRVWTVLSASRERAIGHRVADSLLRELDAMPKDSHEQRQEYDVAVRRTRRMHMDSGIRAALDHLRTITAHEVEEFDARPELLTFRNGTVDLSTGVLKPHDRDDRLSKLVDHDFDPNARCPRWETFLNEVFPDDPQMPGYMQRLIGYGITGYTSEHVFALLHGHGANGKSVLVNTVAEVFSGIAGHVSQAAVAYVRSYDPGAPNPALAALRGTRIAVLSELSEGLRLNESLLKQLTAGDPVTARELYKGLFTFTPSALLLMATNYRPDVRGQDEGFWRRTRLLPFVREFTETERDPALSRKLLEEVPGIIAWAVKGASAWFAGGLQEPDTVRAAVAEYRQSSDLLDGFLPGVLVRDPDGSILLSEAFRAFEDWRDREQIEQVMRWGTRTLQRHLEARKVKSARSNRGKVLRGIRTARLDDGEAG